MSPLRLIGNEPELGPWQAIPLPEFSDLLAACVPADLDRPAVVAVDGRSASGKSTLAGQLLAQLPDAVVVHTDDVAWYESFFGWDQLLIEGVLEPARDGLGVSFRPPAWDERHRPGAITVPSQTRWLLIEGVGASRGSLRPHLDAAVWVTSDALVARTRGIERDGGPQREWFWDEWAAQEEPFLAAERPWDHAGLVTCGTPAALGLALAPGQVLLGTPRGGARPGPRV